MDFKNLHESKNVRAIIIGIFVLVAAIVIFQAGLFVGYRKASFSFQMGDNYYRAFGQRDNRFMQGLYGRDLPGANGAVGKIVSISLPTIVVASRDGVEKDIVVGTSTVLRRFMDTVSPSDLKVEDFIVVIGSPNGQGQIEARFVRVMPASDNDADNGNASSSKMMPSPTGKNFQK